jgi:hypothetical protein
VQPPGNVGGAIVGNIQSFWWRSSLEGQENIIRGCTGEFPSRKKKTPSLFHVCKKKKEKKRRLEVKKGELATPEVKPEPPPSPISSQHHHIDCGENFAMLVPKVTDLAT